MKNRNAFDILGVLHENNKHLCIGLDPNKFPKGLTYTDSPGLAIAKFNCSIINATKHLAASYKLNFCFYERYGARGLEALERTCRYILEVAPDTLLILDRKAGDIGSTNEGTAHYAFNVLNADAITLHSYMGSEAMRPFLEREEKFNFVLCATSNPGASQFQNLAILHAEEGEGDLYHDVARVVTSTWNKNGNCGLVAGATNPYKITEIVRLAPNLPLLIPGIGAQGGDLAATIKAVGASMFLINSSRGIIEASSGPDFAEAARVSAEKLNNEILACKQVAV